MAVNFTRPQARELARRLKEPRRFIQSISGARQVGKTTLALQVAKNSKLSHHYANADQPVVQPGGEWIASQWEEARFLTEKSKGKNALLILDEVQKIPQWSTAVKSLWDEDTRKRVPLKVILLGSAPLLMGRGLKESLAGRFETLYMPHWSFAEMQEAFGWGLEKYLFYGAYPGAVPLINDRARWSDYIKNSLMETIIARDVLLLSRIDKPALIRRLFELGCAYSGQIISYRKIAGQLQDRGNVTTLVNYLDLLEATGTLGGLQKYTGSPVSSRRSIPKMQVFNTALMTAQTNMTQKEFYKNKNMVGRLTESAVGAHLINAAAGNKFDLFYWREHNQEVDFVLRKGQKIVAIEVKSGRVPGSLPGLDSFSKKFKSPKLLVVGESGISLETFLSREATYWLE